MLRRKFAAMQMVSFTFALYLRERIGLVNRIPRTSVLMPVFKDGPYVQAAIDSILSQTFEDFELIIVDDGSTDNTQDVLQRYTDSRIKLVLHKKNLGRPYARNTALSMARGEYLFWMDSDDISLPRRLEKQMAFMDRHPDIAVCGGAVQCFHGTDEHIVFPQKPEAIHTALFFAPAISNPASCIRRSVIEKFSLRYDVELPRAQDYEFWCRMLLDCKLKAANLRDTLLLYRSRVGAYRDSHMAAQRRILERLNIDATEERLMQYVEFSLAAQRDDISYPLESYKSFLKMVLKANAQVKIFEQKALARRLYHRLVFLAALTEPVLVRRVLRGVKVAGAGWTARSIVSFLNRKGLSSVASWLQTMGR